MCGNNCNASDCLVQAENENRPSWLKRKLSDMKWWFVRLRHRWEKSAMETWVEREVKIAIDRERAADKEDCEKRGKKYNPKDFSYGGAIYESALKAYKSLLKDGHSGMSWAFTTNVLNRMMQHKVLTPLQGTDDEWHECEIRNDDGTADYQNVRQSTLFKHVHPDGTVTYNDVDRAICVDADDKGDTHHFGLSASVVDEMFPITFPYMPSDKAYRVVDRIFATNGNPGEFDTVGILRVECPDGSVHLINKFYKEGKDDWIAINMEEFELRLQSYKDLLNNK